MADIIIPVEQQGLEDSIINAVKKIPAINVKINAQGLQSFSQPLGRINSDIGDFNKSLDAANASAIFFSNESILEIAPAIFSSR